MARRCKHCAGPEPLRRTRAPHAGARQHPARRQVSDGGFFLRRRRARFAGRAGRSDRRQPARPVTAARWRENIDRRQGLQRRRDPHAGQRPAAKRRPRGAARQPRARRRRHQAGRDGAAASCATRAARSSSRTTTTWPRASIRQTWISLPTALIVLQSAGPQGAPGMPEWGQLPIPQKLLKEGVRDMLRISDARMSGTSYGACVLHVTPESHVGGPLALVRDGDEITLDVEARRIDLNVSEAELARRKAAWRAPPAQVRPWLRCAVSQARRAGRHAAATSIFWRRTTRPTARRRAPRRHLILASPKSTETTARLSRTPQFSPRR